MKSFHPFCNLPNDLHRVLDYITAKAILNIYLKKVYVTFLHSIRIRKYNLEKENIYIHNTYHRSFKKVKQCVKKIQ